MSGDRRWYRLAGALRLPAWLWVAASLAVPLQIFGQARIGSEFQVNSYTTATQGRSKVAFDAAGNFVVVWHSNQQDGSSYGVFGQRFSSLGAALGEEFQVNQHFTDSQMRPSVAVDADGDFVVAWQSFGGQDGDSAGVFGRRYSSDGVAVGGEFLVNTTTSDFQGTPAAAAEPDGDFVVVWSDLAGIFAQGFTSAGTPIGGEFQVNTYTASGQRYPSVAMVPGGGFVVSWESYNQEGAASGFGVFVQRFSSAGDPLGGETPVNTFTIDTQGNSVVAVQADGSFVVTWSSDLQDGSDYGVFARQFSSAGDAVNGEVQVNTYTESNANFPALAAAPDGGFIVVWDDYGGGDRILARRLSSTGSPVADEFQVNTYSGYPGEPVIAIDGAGDFVVVWSGYGQDGSFGYGVFAQRFGSGAPSEVELDIDGDGQVDALTDGALVLRRLFGFSGTTLTNGVDTEGCSRCEAEDIEPYIAGLGLALDIDGDGALEPLTDGLLALRYLFSFTGAALTDGAVNLEVGGCTRCDAAAIEPYLLGLTS